MKSDDHRFRDRLPGLSRVLALATLGTLAGTLLGFIGAHGWVLDLVANLRTQLLILAVTLVIAMLVVGSRLMALVAFVAAAINLALVVPLMIEAPTTASAQEAVLDVTFFNAKIGTDIEETIAYFEQRDDDVIVLASTTPAWIPRMEAANLGLHVVSGNHITPGLELVVMARDPNADVDVYKLTDSSRDSLVEVVVELDGEPLHVLGCHPLSPKTPERASRRDLLLDWIGRWSDQRDAPVVVVGDLNATVWSAPFRSMLARGELQDSLRVHGLQPSWPAVAGPLGLAIDHVLHSADVVVLERELGPSFGSDHRMVHARVAHAT